MIRFHKAAVLALALLLGNYLCLRAADEPLPKAETILEKYVQVTGGKAAYDKIHSEVSTGAVEFVGKGVKGTMNAWRAEPNKSYVVLDIEGVGKVEEGTNGDIAWEKSALQGPRIKEGEERAVALREADVNSINHWRDHYVKAETTGIETVDDQACYKVVLTPREGKPESRYFDKKTGLLVKTTQTMKSPMGEIPMEGLLSDYRNVDGVLVPHKMQQKALGQEIQMTLKTVQWNADVPKDRFDLPDDVKALAQKSSGSGPRTDPRPAK